MLPRFAVVNGPNLNLLGKREPDKYGLQTLNQINTELQNYFEAKAELVFFQSNHEGEIIEFLHSFTGNGLALNLGAYTHTSIAIRDALTYCLSTNSKLGCLAVEVHLSNIHARESFRYKSYISDVSSAVIAGCGALGYRFALEFLMQKSLVQN